MPTTSLKAIELTNASEDDVLTWLPRYLERTVVLWINVAWDRTFKGDAQVQVTLRDDNGIVLGSRIVRTNCPSQGKPTKN